MKRQSIDYSVNEILRDGKSIVIRTIRRDDRERLGEHFASLSPDSRYRRFFGLRHNFGPRELDRLVSVEYPLHLALIATVRNEHGDEVIIGDSRCVADPNTPHVSEMALSVSDAWQGRGVATALFAQLEKLAAQAGVRRLTADVMVSNIPAVHFLLAQAFRVTGRAAGILGLTRSVGEPIQRDQSDTRAAAIRERAYQLYLARGARHGEDFDDWLAAERELTSAAS
jgi:GNAT superfamily N-acetyltransferase